MGYADESLEEKQNPGGKTQIVTITTCEVNMEIIKGPNRLREITKRIRDASSSRGFEPLLPKEIDF